MRLATDGIGPSLTIDTTGALPIITEALEMTSVLGRMILLGMSKNSLEIDMTKFKLVSHCILLVILVSNCGLYKGRKVSPWERARGRHSVEGQFNIVACIFCADVL